MKTAIVTGASGGIGGAIVKRLCKQGYFVFAHYNGNENAVNELVKEFPESVYKIKFDLKNQNEIKNSVADALSLKKHIDLLVNCAGVDLYKLSNETSKEEWESLFSVNVTGAHIVTSAVLDYMISQKSGKLVNVSSIWGNVGASMEVCYSASKSAIIGYTKALAKEVAPSGITVNCVCPGVIDTAMNSRFNAEEMNCLIESTPLGRIGLPQDVASLVCFLASDDADFITGQIITVDGGFTL